MPSTPTVTVTYLFDPLCGWCYAAAPVLARLQATPGVQVVLAPTGLFAGAGARLPLGLGSAGRILDGSAAGDPWVASAGERAPGVGSVSAR